MHIGKFTPRAGLAAALAGLMLTLTLSDVRGDDSAKPSAKPQVEKEQAGKKKAAACDPQQFIGTYHIVSGQQHDRVLPKEEIAGTKSIITAATIVTQDKNEQETYSASYQLAPGRNGACRLTMTSEATPARKEITTHGLIKREGRTVTLIYALPGGATPDDFQPDAHQQLFVLKPEVKEKPAATK
jgi:hypothetical protein